MGNTAHRDIREQDRAELASKALEMRRRGASYEAIAKAIGYADRSGAKKLINWAYEQTLRENVEEARELELQRCDRLQERMEEFLEAGELAAGDRIAKLIELRCKIQGVFAPTKTEVTGKDGGAIEVGPTAAQARELMRQFHGPVTPNGAEPDLEGDT